MVHFINRQEAGRLLAKKLARQFDYAHSVVIGIPRGGMLVAHEIATFFHCPLYALVIKKITLPANPEFAIGAVGPQDVAYYDEELLKEFDLSEKELLQAQQSARAEYIIKEKKYHAKLPLLQDLILIVVDDGAATGATAKAASIVLQKMAVNCKLLFATPVIASRTYAELLSYYQKIEYIIRAKSFHAVGEFYEEFAPVDDQTVIKLLNPPLN